MFHARTLHTRWHVYSQWFLQSIKREYLKVCLWALPKSDRQAQPTHYHHPMLCTSSNLVPLGCLLVWKNFAMMHAFWSPSGCTKGVLRVIVCLEWPQQCPLQYTSEINPFMMTPAVEYMVPRMYILNPMKFTCFEIITEVVKALKRKVNTGWDKNMIHIQYEQHIQWFCAHRNTVYTCLSKEGEEEKMLMQHTCCFTWSCWWEITAATWWTETTSEGRLNLHFCFVSFLQVTSFWIPWQSLVLTYTFQSMLSWLIVTARWVAIGWHQGATCCTSAVTMTCSGKLPLPCLSWCSPGEHTFEDGRLYSCQVHATVANTLVSCQSRVIFVTEGTSSAWRWMWSCWCRDCGGHEWSARTFRWCWFVLGVITRATSVEGSLSTPNTAVLSHSSQQEHCTVQILNGTAYSPMLRVSAWDHYDKLNDRFIFIPYLVWQARTLWHQ